MFGSEAAAAMAAFLSAVELIPKQESTGDRTILGKISKRGNKYVRTLFVQAAQVVLERGGLGARGERAAAGEITGERPPLQLLAAAE